jgi:hypothetical protein
MTEASKKILFEFQVRRTNQQKENFRTYMRSVFQDKYQYNDDPIKIGKKEHSNIIIGDIEKADIILTAHYDTPRIMPPLIRHCIIKNKLLKCLFSIYKIIILLLYIPIPFIFALKLCSIIGLQFEVSFVLALLFPLFLYLYVLLFLPTNKSNYNDNTSGIITLLETAMYIPVEYRSNVAFILFDNEEKGLRGAKAFKKKNPEISDNKIFVNYDCVAVGSNIILSIKKDVYSDNELNSILTNSFITNNNFTFYLNQYTQFKMGSDYKVFRKSVGIVALKKNKVGVLYLNNLHSRKDINFDINNIDVLVDSNINLIKAVNELI